MINNDFQCKAFRLSCNFLYIISTHLIDMHEDLIETCANVINNILQLTTSSAPLCEFFIQYFKLQLM